MKTTTKKTDMQRRTFSIAAVSAVTLGARPAFAQGKGSVLTIVVPYTAGGISDIVARLLAQSMAVTLDRTVVIDNKPGASALIGTKLVQRARPDGNMLLIASQSYMKSPGLLKHFDYDPVNNFVCVAKLTTSPYVLMVTKDVPAKNLKEFIEWGKSRPGGVFCASASSGGAAEVMARAFAQHTGVKVNLVPYKGNSEIITALIGGQTPMTITPSSSVFDAAAEAGHIRYLAVTTKDPSPFYPQLQPLRSFVPNMPVDEQWLAFFAPKGTLAPVVEQLSRAAGKALSDPLVKETLAKNNFQVNYQDTAEFTAYMKRSRAEWETLVKASGVKMEE
jgi:tripartite-type tricarboxylate transporter receptor subunit TctC